MIRFIAPYFSHSDQRGGITGLINFGEWREVNVIRSDAGAIRGNHFHKGTTEAFVLLEGRLRIILERVSNGALSGSCDVVMAEAGQVFLIEPNVCHEFEVLEPSVWINLLDIALNPDNPDMHRPSAPLNLK